MEYTFLYEEALAETNQKKSELSQSTQDNIKSLVKMCHELAEMDDQDVDSQEALNDKIDALDEKISVKIKENLESIKPPAEATLDKNANPQEKSSNNGMMVLGLAVVGGLVWGAIKLFGGKQQ